MTERWERLSRLLDELFDLDEAARAARLACVEADDASLAAELRRALAADARSGVLDAGVANAANTVMTRLAEGHDRREPTQAGAMVGHYRLLERVGSGGMGDVWRGERVGDDFEQQVAIKLIRPLLDSPSLRERFARERRILARLDHPNIARLLDGGVAEDGTPWYAMEFVKGVPLVQYADEHALDMRARVELLLQVCDAVANAQSLLVVHRDLKPSNILVDAQGRARVLDFGIARLLDDSADVALTGTGVRVFSPAYAAPEQIRGDAVGTAADVFALGAVLYELLTGEVPHPKRSAAPERLLAGLADETAPRPSRTLRERGAITTGGMARTTRNHREVGPDLDLIVSTALQPDPARRYAGAAQLADDLRRWLDGRPVSAQADTAGYRMRKFVTRHRLAVGSASAVLLALLAGLALALWQANVARDLARRADAEAQRANAEAARAELSAARALELAGRVKSVKEFFVSAFIQADPLRRSADGPPTVDGAFDALLERARTELASDPVLQADVFDDFGEIRVNQGRFDEGRELFEQALAVAEREYGPAHPTVAESLMNLAIVAHYEGALPGAMKLVDRAVAILEADDGGDPLSLANALNGQATLITQRGEKGDNDRALVILQRALDLYRRQGPEDPKIVAPMTNVATVFSNIGRLDESDALLREVTAIIEKHHGKDATTLWPVYTTMAANAYNRGDMEAQAGYTERALQLVRRIYPDAHPWTASTLDDRGLQISKAGDWKRGEAMMLEGIAMYDELGSPEVVASLRRLAMSQRSHGDLEGSLRSLERAYAICLQNDGPTNTLCLTVRANRALVYARSGRGTEALAEADAALAGLAGDPILYSEQGQAMEARAAAFVALGRKAEAQAELDKVIESMKANFGPDHPETHRVTAARKRLD